MKKTSLLTLTVIIFAACIISCSQQQIPPDTDDPLNLTQDGISDSAYSNMFSSFYYDSFEELYVGLQDIVSNDLASITFRENQYMEDTMSKTHVSEDEQRYGIFGSMSNKLLTEKTLMVPYYKGEQLPLPVGFVEDYDVPYITVSESGACRKSWIDFFGKINDSYVGFNTMYYDRALLDEANEKGASWLMAQLNPEGLNIYNYEEKNLLLGTSHITRIVYERPFQLEDREVLAMVIENDGVRNGIPKRILQAYFVYDDILVKVSGLLEELEFILPDITFREVDFPTNTPLRDAPGREGTKYSTKYVQDVIEDEKDDIPEVDESVDESTELELGTEFDELVETEETTEDAIVESSDEIVETDNISDLEKNIAPAKEIETEDIKLKYEE